MSDWPPQFELMKLQARNPKGGDWVDIFPAQLGWMARGGAAVRAIEAPAQPAPSNPIEIVDRCRRIGESLKDVQIQIGGAPSETLFDAADAIQRLSAETATWKLAAHEAEAFSEKVASESRKFAGKFNAVVSRAEAAEARLAEAMDNHQRLLNGRDDFIVSKGLWSEFVDSLP